MTAPKKKKETVETFTLPSGKIASRYGLTNKDYYDFRKKLQADQDADLATKVLTMRMYLIDGQPLTIDMLEDEEGLDFEDTFVLTNKIDTLFSQLQQRAT